MPPASPTSWEEYAREFGLELQRRRHAAGLTQEGLAHEAGITRNHYQQLERGYWKPGSPANPSLQTVARLAQALGAEIAELAPSAARIDWASNLR